MTVKACPAHGRVQALQQGGEPPSEFYQIVHRISDRLEPEAQKAFLEAIERVRDQIDVSALEAAIAGGNVNAIRTALKADTLRAMLSDPQSLRDVLQRAYASTGDASAGVLSSELGVGFSFDSRDPRAIIFARRNVGTLVTRINDDQLLTIRSLISRAQSEGIPPRRTARDLHNVVGIRHDWAQAPSNLRAEIQAGQKAAATSRRLDAVTKQKIRSRIDRDTVTPDFLDEMQERYANSLRRRRALDIAHTETIRASNAGVQGSWVEAQSREVIPQTARRFYVVTPDDRLRETHAAVPGMNPDGVGVDEPFETPLGGFMFPPIAPNCRCSVALVPNPSEGGAI